MVVRESFEIGSYIRPKSFVSTGQRFSISFMGEVIAYENNSPMLRVKIVRGDISFPPTKTVFSSGKIIRCHPEDFLEVDSVKFKIWWG